MTGTDQPTGPMTNLNQRLDVDFALKAAGLGVWEYDPATGIGNWDERCRQLYGIADGSQISYQQALTYVYPDDRRLIDQAVVDAFKPQLGGHYDVTYRTVGDDGQLRWVRFMGQAAFTTAGEPRRFAGVAQEVTQQVLSEQQRQQVLALFEQSSVGIAVIHEDNLTFQLANPFYERLVGRTAAQLVGLPLLKALPELDGQGFDELLRGVIATGTPFVANEVSVELIRSGRLETIYVDLNYQPWRDTTGRVSGVLVVATDVTQQVRSRQQLQESIDQLRSLVESAPFPIGVYTGPQLQIQLANQAIIDIYGKGPDVIGKNYPELLPELAGQQIVEQLQQVYATGVGFASGTQLVTIDHHGRSTPYYFRYTFTPLFDAKGKVYGVMNMAADVTELELARQQLQTSEARFRSLIEEAPVATCLFVGRDLHVAVANDTMLGYWGKSQTVIGKPLAEALPELAGQPFLALLDEVFTTGRTHEAKAVRAELEVNGILDTYYFDFTYKPLRNEQGAVYAIMNMAVDVTQQVKARQALQQSETRFQNLVRTANVGMIVLEGEAFRITVVNEAYSKLVDHRVDQLLNRPVFEVLPSVEPYLRPMLEQVMTTGELITQPEARYQVQGANGQLIEGFTDTVYQPYREADGRVTGVMAIVNDITKLVNSRQVIAQSEATLRGAIEVADMGTWTLDMETGRTTYSERLRELFEFTRDSIELEHLYNPILEADQVRLADAVRRAATSASTGLLDEEYTIVTQHTGRHRIVRAQGQMYFDSLGRPLRLVGTMRDVTEERQIHTALEQLVEQRTAELAATNEELAASNEEYAIINEELEESNSLLVRSNENLQTFAYVASHDLQEPLRKIQQFGNLLQLREGDGSLDAESAGYVARMQTAASRMSTLIKDLLNYSRISTQRNSEEPVSLNKVVGTVLDTLDMTISQSNAQVQVDVLPIISGDAVQLGQLFQNLLSNALKFHRPGVTPRIHIRSELIAAEDLPARVNPTRRSPTYECIQVIDNGIGFEEKYLDRIFQVFQRLHGKNEFAGTGVGLAICEKVVTNHGGVITARSQPGQGATFSVYLPAQAS